MLKLLENVEMISLTFCEDRKENFKYYKNIFEISKYFFKNCINSLRNST